MADPKDEFVNRTQGYIGAITIDRRGEEKSVAIEPGARIFLTAEEQELTARSHRRAQDSPFVTREIVHYDPLTHDEIDRFIAPLLEKVEQEQEDEPEKVDEEPTGKKPPARRRKAAVTT